MTFEAVLSNSANRRGMYLFLSDRLFTALALSDADEALADKNTMARRVGAKMPAGSQTVSSVVM